MRYSVNRFYKYISKLNAAEFVDLQRLETRSGNSNKSNQILREAKENTAALVFREPSVS